VCRLTNKDVLIWGQGARISSHAKGANVLYSAPFQSPGLAQRPVITAKKFFWCSVAAGLVIGLVGAQLDTFRAWFWLDNMTSPLMSYLRSRDCGRLDVMLRPDCDRAHARATDPAVVAAAEALEREQASMRMAVRIASLPAPMGAHDHSIFAAADARRDALVARFGGYATLRRQRLEAEDTESEASPHLRLTRMVAVTPME